MSDSGPSWTRRIFIALLWILSLAIALVLITTFVIPFFAGLFPHSLSSLDWSGYVVASSFDSPQPLIMGVNASWTVPKVLVSQESSFCAAWIGIGGQLDETLIQTGTEHDSVNGTDSYFAWYELLPYDVVSISGISVSAGDKMVASINLVDPATNQWSIEISDTTNGQSFSKDLHYVSSRLTAEWIVERPDIGERIGTLANFGNVAFTSSSAKMNAASGPISAFPFVKVVMRDRQNKALVTVSPLTADGSSFSVNYLNSVPTTTNSR
jgi:hypothetical protein